MPVAGTSGQCGDRQAFPIVRTYLGVGGELPEALEEAGVGLQEPAGNQAAQ